MPRESEFDRLDFKPGQPLLARDLQAIVDYVRNQLGDVEGGHGVVASRGARGRVHVTGTRPESFYGVAAANIAPASGDTPAAGTVTRYRWGGTSYETTGVTYDVLNPSTTAMTSGNGIDSGMRVWVIEDDSGNLVVFPLECA